MLDLELRPQARQVLAAGRTTDPMAYDSYVQGRGLLQNASNRAQLEAATQRFEEAVARDPKFALAYAGLGETAWRLYQETRDTSWVAAARAHSDHALALDSALPTVWVTLGLVGVGTGRHTEAIEALQRALAIDPYSAEAYRLLANAYRDMGEPKQAEATYQRAIALKPYDWLIYNSLGVFYFQQGRYDEAAEQFLKVAELNPSNVRGYSNAGGIYFFLERWDEARRLFERTLAIQPTARAYSNLGTLDFYEGEYARASRRFEQAIELTPADYLMWGNAADAYRWVPGETARADSLYHRALELARAARRVNATDPALLSRILQYHAALGERDSVTALLGVLEPLVGNDPEIMFSSAWALAVLGERASALGWLGRALAAGFSRRVVERAPSFRELRRDPRFRALVAVKP
jgi:serine/threonine-protein kinase